MEAAAGGLLDETHWVELKESLPPGNRGSNTELAKDLASLAVDGGLFVVGVEDDDGRAGEVCGAALAGLADRVGQVARDRVRPSLVVRCHEVPHPDRPGVGCLFVHVPPSSGAPHMVDNVYYGRTDKAKFPLNDERVREILAARARGRADISAELRQLAEDDPFPEEERQFGHIYVVAQPEFGPDDALVGFLTGPDATRTIVTLLAQLDRGDDRWRHSPRSVTGLGGPSRRAEGLAVSSHYPEPKPRREQSLLEIVVREDGGIRLTCGQGTDEYRTYPGQEELPQVLFPGLALYLTQVTASLAGRLGDQYAAYQGQWQIGLLQDRLRGAWPVDHFQTHGAVGSPYSRDTYERATSASTEELVNAPKAVAERVVARLLRALGVSDRYSSGG